MDDSTLYQLYLGKTPQYKKLMEAAKFQLDAAIKSQKIKIHSLSSRLKSFDSFMSKTKRKSANYPFEEINDLVGLRVICLFLSDLNKVGKIIKDTFELIREDNRIDDGPKDVFGYLDIQYVLRLKKSHIALEVMATTPFEIQVRTIAQDAWASVSHHLDYKCTKAIPNELERDFHALSGLFYVADQHFKILEERSTKFPIPDSKGSLRNKAEHP